MTLLKRLVIIFASVTVICSICFFFIGNSIVEQISTGEFSRGSGRARGVILNLDAEVNVKSNIAIEFANYLEIIDNLSNIGDISEEIMGIKKKAKNTDVNTIITLDKDFLDKSIIKGDLEEVKSLESKSLIKNVELIMRKPEFFEKGILTGIVSTTNYPYIVGVKRINQDEKETSDYVMVMERIDDIFIEFLSNKSGRNISLLQVTNNASQNKDDYIIEHFRNFDRDFYIKLYENSISIFTQIDTFNDDMKFFIELKDSREVRENAQSGVNALLVIVIGLTIIANVIIYALIRNNVISRIIKINEAVNGIKEGNHLNVQIKDNELGDEISTLNKDLNGMFKRLKNYSDNLQYIGSHDALTGIENRYSITRYISKLTKNNEEFTILFLDLDNFKIINDNLGHEVGDNLLIKVSTDLMKIKSENSNISVGRLGGDEFIIVRKGKNNEEEIKVLARKILNKINKLYEINSYNYEIKASMGISFYPDHTKDEGELLQYSDIAMYCSKKQGGNIFNIFNEQMLEPLKIEKMIKRAIEFDEFEVYLQPIYDVHKNKMRGSEALIRWNNKGKIIPPNKFIPIAKKTGDIVDIDNMIFSKSVAICRELLDSGKKNFYISINTSKLFLQQVGLIAFMTNELKENNISPEYIKVEVTEDEIIDDFEQTIDVLNKIREIGIEIYLDDFGVGYSSFSHIKVLPVDVIKIDRSLILDIEYNPKTQEIVNTMILLAHNLNMSIVCEGVEEESQVEILRKLKCDNIQGYYFSKPLPKNEFKVFIQNFNDTKKIY
ncbi:MAG: EAL domain-containing protein [Paraclostridium sp.]|uniref:EAL domain-containing protein n=1 Tax=Paraclostridium sp. TaxID=2023273 RepID=UPI003F3494EC